MQSRKMDETMICQANWVCSHKMLESNRNQNKHWDTLLMSKKRQWQPEPMASENSTVFWWKFKAVILSSSFLFHILLTGCFYY